MSVRQKHLERLSSEKFDVLIVGGGINGAVSAAALSARGLKVGLIDSRDFAGFTSQHSSNLIWGGIKYLESYEFGLVAGLCKARNKLLQHYPSQVEEIRFLASIPQSFRRHPLLVWAGAWIYWLMGRGFTRRPRYLAPEHVKRIEPVIDLAACRAGVEYSDAYLRDNDARFVFGFVRSTLNSGGVACNYLSANLTRHDKEGDWSVNVEDRLEGGNFSIRCRAIVNAAGPFADAFNKVTGIKTRYRHLFSKGIHLIIPQISKSKRVLAFFAADGRLFFAIPMGDRTCVGTTDTSVSEPYTQVTEEDRDFVLNNINAYLELPRPLGRGDIIAERCGVRPLAIEEGGDESVDFLQLSRKHVVEVAADKSYLSIFGGKLTDCLNVGEEVVNRIRQMGIAPLPGREQKERCWFGEPGQKERDRYCARATALLIHRVKLSATGESLMNRLWRRYGLDAFSMLDAIESDRSLTMPVIEGANLYHCELIHLAENEMITSLEDLLHRRTNLGLVMPREKLAQSEGIMVLCRAVFGAQARQQYETYFGR